MCSMKYKVPAILSESDFNGSYVHSKNCQLCIIIYNYILLKREIQLLPGTIYKMNCVSWTTHHSQSSVLSFEFDTWVSKSIQTWFLLFFFFLRFFNFHEIILAALFFVCLFFTSQILTILLVLNLYMFKSSWPKH